MMGWKKYISMGLALALSLSGGLAAWLGLPSQARAEAERLSIVATVFPAYDFAREVTGGEAELKLLLPPGGEAHSYEPTPQDIIAIQKADLFIYTGGESDQWIERILESLGAEAPPSFAMTDCVAGLEEEFSQSMEAHSHDAEAHGHSEGEACPELEAEMDEHVWTSPRNAMLIVKALAAKLTELAPQNAEAYAVNAEAYQDKLKALDEAFRQVAESGRRKLIIFGDRFPFRYFAAAYGLDYDAAFPGCSEDSEPSVKTVISLTDAIRENDVPVVFYIEFSSRKTADTLCEETGARARLFHSCHTVSAEEMANGATYLTLMAGNVEALKEALN